MLRISILKKWKKCISVNNIQSKFDEIVSGVPEGSVVGLFYVTFFQWLFCFILVASTHNVPDDYTVSSFTKTIENLISTQESESEIAIYWFKDNHRIVNPGKFQVIKIKSY